MRIFRTFIIGLFAFCGLPAAAQDAKALGEAFAQVLNKGKYTVDIYDSLATVLSSKNRRRPEVQVEIARAYFRNHDRDKANIFIDKALKLDSKYSPAYILKGDMAASEQVRDTTAAIEAFRQAMAANPKDAKGYERYMDMVAARSPEDAIAVLGQLKSGCPDYPVELAKARVWSRVGNLQKAVEAYELVDKDIMDISDVVDYALDLNLMGCWERSMDIVGYGLKRYPGKPVLNRIALYNSADMGLYDEALAYSSSLFNTSDTISFIAKDYLYTALAHEGIKNYDKAIDMYLTVLIPDTTLTKYEDRVRENEYMKMATARIRNVIDSVGVFDYEYAARLYDRTLDHKLNVRNKPLTEFDIYNYARVYRAALLAADEHPEWGRVDIYNKIDSLYGILENKYPEWVHIVNVYADHGDLKSNVFDPEGNDGLYIPYYDKAIAMIKGRKTSSDDDNDMLVSLYWKEAVYYLYHEPDKKRYPNTRKCCMEILKLDPSHSGANKMKSMLKIR